MFLHFGLQRPPPFLFPFPHTLSSAASSLSRYPNRPATPAFPTVPLPLLSRPTIFQLSLARPCPQLPYETEKKSFNPTKKKDSEKKGFDFEMFLLFVSVCVVLFCR